MAVLNFPSSPTVGDTYTENNVIYTWNGTFWAANNAQDLDARFVNVTGDTMTGDLNLPNLVATGDVQSTSQNGGQLAGFRNQIINGAMLINQRNNSNLSNHNEFCPDRWLNVGTTTLGLNKLTTNGFVGAGLKPVSGTGIVRQAIELPKPINLGGNVPDPYSPFQPNSVWTLSLYADAANPGLVNDTMQYADDAQGSNPSTAAAGAGWVDIGGGRFSNTFTFNGSIPAAHHNCVTVQLQWTSGRIGGVQLEPGPVATPFEVRPVGTELALCRRYFVKTTFQVEAGSGKTDVWHMGMRTTPTAAALSGGATPYPKSSDYTVMGTASSAQNATVGFDAEL